MPENQHQRREKRWGQRNMAGIVWGMIFATVVWAVIIVCGVLIYRAVN